MLLTWTLLAGSLLMVAEGAQAADGATFISQTVPSSMVAGQQYSVSITMRNSGTTTWLPSSSYGLNSPDGSWTRLLRAVSTSVAPGSSFTFSFVVTAPATPGTYNFQYQMVQEMDAQVWFGDRTPALAISVTSAAPAQTSNAFFHSQTVPTIMVAGRTYSASVTMTNIGTTTWTAAELYKLGSQDPQDNQIWGNAGRVALPAAVPPSGQTTFSFNVTAPTTPGTYKFQWQMLQENVTWFGDKTTDATVTVVGPPTVNISAPANGAQYLTTGSSSSVTISGTAAAASGAFLTGVELYEGTTYLGGAGSSGQFSWTQAFGIGTHTLTVKAYDNQSQVSSATVTFTVSPPPPVATLSAPATGTTSIVSSGTTSTLAFSGSAVAGGTASIAQLDMLDGSTVIGTVKGASLSGSYPFVIGSHSLTLRAKDSAGQFGYAYATLIVKRSPPSATLYSPVDGSTYSIVTGTTVPVPVSGYAAVNYSGATLSKVEILDNGVALSPSYSTANVSANINLAAGKHKIQLRVSDNLSGQTLSDIANVTIGVSVPTAALTTPLNGARYVTASTAATTVSVAFSGTGTAYNGATVTLLELTEDLTNGTTSTLASTSAASLSSSKALAIGTHILRMRVTDSTGQKTSSAPATVTVAAPTTGNNAYFVSQVMANTLRPGQPASATITMLNGGTTTWPAGGTFRLGARNPQDNRIWSNQARVVVPAAVAPGQQVTFSLPTTAPTNAGVYNFQWQMVNDTTDATQGWFGEMTPNLQVTVAAAGGPSAALTVTPTNPRVSGTASATLTFTGTGTLTGGLVTKLELFKDSGSGYAATAALTKTGSAASLTLTGSQAVVAGTYWYKVRATDSTGLMTESAPVLVSVTNSTLLGQVTGVRNDANSQPQLVGWVCQKSSAQGLNFNVLLDAPSIYSGGTILTTGVANVSTEPDNSTVQTSCATPGAGHHFVVDLSAYTGQYSGRALYVQPSTAAGVPDQALPCADNTCTIPGSMRINLISPANNSVYKGPATVAMVAHITGASAPFDEVAFSFDGGAWTAGTLDPAVPNQYALSKTSVAIRSTPYLVQARVRQGKSTVYSMQSSITVGSADVVNLVPSSPVEGASFSAGTPIQFSVTPTGATALISSVQFYVNGTSVAATLSGSTWTATWTSGVNGPNSVVVKAFSSTGALLATSNAVNFNVGLGLGGTSSVPIAVNIAPPHLTNADAGTLPGALGVSNGGAATYSIALVMPPGAAGVVPTLSLDYSGDAPNSLLGVGWSLGGLSRITRCGRTIAQDGVNGRIAFDHGDRLCLDGKRLVLVNLAMSDDNYWADNAEYRTEIDDFSRVTAKGSGASRSFQVELKNGRIMTYGSTGDSFVQPILGTPNSGIDSGPSQPKSGAQSWALDRVTDRLGNYVNFTYEQIGVTGEHRPTSIRYGGAGMGSHAGVQFSYESRPDAWTRYIDETRNDLRSRITHITTYVADDGKNLDTSLTSGNMVRDYVIGYEQSQTSGRSLLDTVTVSARNPETGALDTLPPTKFTWGQPVKQPGFVSVGYWTGAPVLTTWKNVAASGSPESDASAMHSDYFAFSDFEGNGYTDVLEKRVASPTQSPLTDPNPIPMGTMRSSYRYFHNNGANANGVGGSFTVYNYNISTGENFVVLDVGDFDGDGALDLLVNTASGNSRICLSPLGKPSRLTGTITFNCDASRPAGGANDTSAMPYVVDIMGDGRSVHYGPTNTAGYATLYLQNTYQQDLSPPPVLSGKFLDDGSPDFSHQAYVSIDQIVDFTGIGKPYDVRWTNPHVVDYTYPDGQPFYHPHWEGTQPTVVLNNFQLPGSTSTYGNMLYYRYPDYGPGDPNTVIPRYAFDTLLQGAGLSGDFNGSGYTTLAFGYLGLNFDANMNQTYGRAEMTLCLSTGRALDCGIRYKYSSSRYAAVRAVGNFVGDGVPSIMTEVLDYSQPLVGGNFPRGTGAVKMCHVTGDDTSTVKIDDASDSNIVCDPWPGVTVTSQAFLMDLMGTGRMQLMVYHPGAVNANGVWQEDGRWEVFAPIDRAKSTEALDRIVSVTNGVGDMSSVEYADALAGGLVKYTDARLTTYPDHGAGMTGKLVSRLVRGNGVAGSRSSTYQYFDPASNVAGRGSLGFGKIVESDEQKGVVTTSTFAQVWPFSGMVLTSTQVAAGVTLSNTINTPATKAIAQANGGSTTFAYTSTSQVCRHDVNGSDLGCATTTNAYGDNYGNLTDQKVVQQLGSGTSYTTESATSFYSCTTWLPALPQVAMVTRTDPTSASAQQSLTRTHQFEYDCTSGLLLSDTAEPGNALYSVKTAYAYNAMGLATGKTQTWFDPQARANVTRTVLDVTYDSNGRYPLTSNTWADATHSYSETHTYVAATGAHQSALDANGLTTLWKSDGLGRVLREIEPDGNERREYVKQCQGDCPSGATVAHVVDSIHTATGERISVPTVTYLDSVGHAVRTMTWGYNGDVNSAAIYIDQTYDSLGRAEKKYQPRYAGGAQTLESRQLYDVLDRVTSLITLDENGTEQATTTAYQGLTRVVTNPKLQRRTELRNVAGELMQVTDDSGKVTSFGYEPFGGLGKTTDPNGNVITVCYDLQGRKTDLKDPDLGWIHYDVDPLGRTWSQTSPNQRSVSSTPPAANCAGANNVATTPTTMSFDWLDRMTGRQESDLSSYWVFDTAVHGVGKLAEAYTMLGAVKDYDRVHSYDGVGRPLQTTQQLYDGVYKQNLTYDAWGRVVQDIYQRGSDAAKQFESRYNGNGYLTRLERGALIVWQVNAQDAAQRPVQIALGNGLTQSRTFNVSSGRLTDALLNNAAGQARLHEGYNYDALGSVMHRTQYWDKGGFQENFTYDNLGRLASSQVDVQAAYSYLYDAAGNLTTKGTTTDVTHTYPGQGAGAVRPHAVQTVSGLSGTFVYDANGNLTGGAGRTISWTSFDMPQLISKGGVSATFKYGPEHQRTRQVRGDGTTVVYAGAQEVENNNGQLTVKTYWPYGVGVEIDRPGASASELNWVHKDRLGSPVAITSQTGDVVEKLAYDAWGKRRMTDGSNTTPDTLDGVRDNRGYTGHEMLDQLDLVHMNGRVYDPYTARFLSGDPFVQDPVNGQSYNRYSYVLNNPTNLTDPTGFKASMKCYNGPGLFNTCAQSFLSELRGKVENSFNSFVDSVVNPTPGKVSAKNPSVTAQSLPAENSDSNSANTAPNGGILTQLKDGYTGDNRSVMWSETGAEQIGRYVRNVIDLGINFGTSMLPGSSFPEVGAQAGQGNYGLAAIALGTELLGPFKAIGGAEKALVKEGFADLAAFRSGLGLKTGDGTLARLDIGGQSFYGINAHGQPITMNVNAITRTHAEADAFQQALNAGAKGGNATLFVDRALCLACGQNGGVRSMARQLGVGQVTVVTPQGIQVIKP